MAVDGTPGPQGAHGRRLEVDHRQRGGAQRGTLSRVSPRRGMVPMRTGASIGHPAPASLKACPCRADESGSRATARKRSGALTPWTSSMWRTSSLSWKGCTTPVRSAHPKQPPERPRSLAAVRISGLTAARNRAPQGDGPSAPARRQLTAPKRHVSGTLDDGGPARGWRPGDPTRRLTRRHLTRRHPPVSLPPQYRRPEAG